MCLHHDDNTKASQTMETTRNIKNLALVSDLRLHGDASQKWGVNCPNCHYADTFVKQSQANDAKRAHACAPAPNEKLIALAKRYASEVISR